MIGYSRNMGRYIGCAGCPSYRGVGGILDFISQIFAPGLYQAEQMAEAIKKAEAEKAAAAQAAAAAPTVETQARLAAAEAQIAQLKEQQALAQRSTEVIRPREAGINWLAVTVVGVGAYYLLFSKKEKPRRRRRKPRKFKAVTALRR